MRSDLVFGAHALVPNRYLLCKLTAKATREFHPPGARIHDTTNAVLERLSYAKSISDLQASHERRPLTASAVGVVVSNLAGNESHSSRRTV
jgi:hypothetical protein